MIEFVTTNSDYIYIYVYMRIFKVTLTPHIFYRSITFGQLVYDTINMLYTINIQIKLLQRIDEYLEDLALRFNVTTGIILEILLPQKGNFSPIYSLVVYIL